MLITSVVLGVYKKHYSSLILRIRADKVKLFRFAFRCDASIKNLQAHIEEQKNRLSGGDAYKFKVQCPESFESRINESNEEEFKMQKRATDTIDV